MRHDLILRIGRRHRGGGGADAEPRPPPPQTGPGGGEAEGGTGGGVGVECEGYECKGFVIGSYGSGFVVNNGSRF